MKKVYFPLLKRWLDLTERTFKQNMYELHKRHSVPNILEKLATLFFSLPSEKFTII